MFVQIAYALGIAYPLSKNLNTDDQDNANVDDELQNVDYNLRKLPETEVYVQNFPVYQSYLHPEAMGHDNAFPALSKAARMESANAMEYQAQCGRIRQQERGTPPELAFELHEEMKRRVWSFLVFALLEKAF